MMAPARSPPSNNAATRPAIGGQSCHRACSATYRAICLRQSSSVVAVTTNRGPSTPHTTDTKTGVSSCPRVLCIIGAAGFPRDNKHCMDTPLRLGTRRVSFSRWIVERAGPESTSAADKTSPAGGDFRSWSRASADNPVERYCLGSSRPRSLRTRAERRPDELDPWRSETRRA
jgi:hypothetical protein